MKRALMLVCLLLVALSGQMLLAQDCTCHSCDDPLCQRGPEKKQYWDNLATKNRLGSDDFELGPQSLLGDTQVVFLDFESGNDGTIDYTEDLRDAIQAELEVIYQDFNVSFTQSNPGGQFSTIIFNEGGPGTGFAEDIDFRNINRSDNAVLNVSGIGLGTNDELIAVSSFVAGHELGHLLGLRHADMFGPIGQGILPGFSPFYLPEFAGPENALESENHVMATGSFGIPFSVFFEPSWFSERSAVKIAVAEFGVTTSDVEDNDSIESAQPLTWQNLTVPNTIVNGENEGAFDFSVSAVVVEGSLDGLADPHDVFRMEARSGDLLNLEVLSNVPDRLAINPIDPNVSIFDSEGQLVDYYGIDAFNESEIKSPDAIVIDLIVPADGDYFIQVDSLVDTDGGNYELFVYRFNGVQGDVNCDGIVTLLDVAPFVDAIVEGNNLPKADVNNDGLVNLSDIQPMVDLLNSN